MSTRQLNRACHSAAADAGIAKRVSLHTLRHYAEYRIMPSSTERTQEDRPVAAYCSA
jgi:integrase